jgi:PAS domain S-box-containing protein
MPTESTDDRLRIDAVVREVHRAVCAADDCEQLDVRICEAFAESEPYVFAWIGEYDSGTGTVVPRAAAGVDEGYLDDISISVDEEPDSAGPTATAVRSGEIQTVQQIREDPDYQPWREAALDRGYESSAAVPITDDEDRYGVLNVYSARPGAFDDDERRLLAELGETIGAAVERLKTRAKLHARKRQYERLTERISDAYYAVDADWEITYWNDQMATRTDVPAEEVVGETVWDAFPEILGTKAETNYREAMATQKKRSFELYLDDPFEYWVEADVYPNDDGLSVFSREITDRKESERELRETTKTLRAIIEASPDPIVMLDDELRVTMWNPAAEAVFGWTEDEIVGERAPFVPDEKVTEFDEFIERLDTGTDNRFVDTVRRTKTGDRIDVSLSSTKVAFDGAMVGYLGVFKDITRRKAYEHRLEEQRDGLEVLNQIVRHDIRNDLQRVSAYAEMLGRSVEGDTEEYVEKIRASVDSATALTHSAGELAEVMVSADRDPDPVPLRSTLASQLEETRATHSGASVTTDGPIPSVDVLADEMLSSVFRNLLKNAVQHNDADLPEVVVSVTEDDDVVTVRVADNGPGIDDDRKDAVFGKGEKRLDSPGTGIGLYLVESLVSGYGGAVRIEDNDPRGAVFAVELPRAAGSA